MHANAPTHTHIRALNWSRQTRTKYVSTNICMSFNIQLFLQSVQKYTHTHLLWTAVIYCCHLAGAFVLKMSEFRVEILCVRPQRASVGIKYTHLHIRA